MVEQAVHAPSGSRALGGEEDEQRLLRTPAAARVRTRHPNKSFLAIGRFKPCPYTARGVRDLYTIGVIVGFGVGLGVLAAALLAGARLGLALALTAAAAGGVALGLSLADAEEAIGAAAGGLAGAFGAGVLARGALSRGGARVATAALLVLAALVLGLLALIPGVGYLEALVLPTLAMRVRRTGSRRYAGLRILARD
jgi:hypothetical protein